MLGDQEPGGRASRVVPPYEELPTLEGGSDRHAWGVFEDGDRLGTLNRIGPQEVIAGASEVVSGRVISLDLPVDFGRHLSASRRPMEHNFSVSRGGMDDWLDSFYLQSSTQWDGFRHVRFRQLGYFGGRLDEELLKTNDEIGVSDWAERGIVTRGVLVDIPAERKAAGAEWDPTRRSVVTTQMIESALAAAKVQLRQGDVLLIRTGWLAAYRELTEDQRAQLPKLGSLASAGLDPSEGMARWLWDAGVAAVAADNPALEALPVLPEEGFLHRRLLPLLGMPIGELWDLDRLADVCSRECRWTGLLTSAPLRVAGATGSPANAYFVM